MRKERRIQDQIETDGRILLEYGVPLNTIHYKMVWEKTDEYGDSEEISIEAMDLVEAEFKAGRPGAIVIRRMDLKTGSDNVEVWGWAD